MHPRHRHSPPLLPRHVIITQYKPPAPKLEPPAAAAAPAPIHLSQSYSFHLFCRSKGKLPHEMPGSTVYVVFHSMHCACRRGGVRGVE